MENINIKKLRPYFLLTLLVLAGILIFFVFRPFLYALILAIVFTIVFQPLHRKILQWLGNWHSVAALATTTIIIIVILAPLIFLGIQILQEAQQLYTSLTKINGNNIILTTLKSTTNDLHRLFPITSKFSINTEQYINQISTWLAQHTLAVFSNIIKLLASLFIFLVSLYYLLRDGHKLKKTFTTQIPLTNAEDEAIFKKLEVAVNSVIKGNLIIAIIQGVLAGIGFAVFGVPNFILWGTITAVAALIPGIGTAIVLVPIILFLYFTGNVFGAIGLLIWGALVVGLIDNFLRPILIGRGIKIHPLLVFLSVFGGLIFFGPIGFLLGPLTISLFFALLHIYSSMRNEAVST